MSQRLQTQTADISPSPSKKSKQDGAEAKINDQLLTKFKLSDDEKLASDCPRLLKIVKRVQCIERETNLADKVKVYVNAIPLAKRLTAPPLNTIFQQIGVASAVAEVMQLRQEFTQLLLEHRKQQLKAGPDADRKLTIEGAIQETSKRKTMLDLEQRFKKTKKSLGLGVSAVSIVPPAGVSVEKSLAMLEEQQQQDVPSYSGFDVVYLHNSARGEASPNVAGQVDIGQSFTDELLRELSEEFQHLITIDRESKVAKNVTFGIVVGMNLSKLLLAADPKFYVQNQAVIIMPQLREKTKIDAINQRMQAIN